MEDVYGWSGRPPPQGRPFFISEGRRSPIRLMLGDCLEVMADIPDGSVDLVLCDLPISMM